MSRRAYRLGRRQETADETRTRILAAAKELLAASDGVPALTMEAIARQAGVARMTVYHQFQSKQGLMEALLDLLAASGGMKELRAAFTRPDPLEALDAFIETFAHFWGTHRLVHRRLHGLAAIDPEFEPVWRTRQGWRRKGVDVLVRRLANHGGRSDGEARAESTAALFTLTAFSTFDILAGETRTPEDVAPLIQRLARAALGIV